MPRSSESADSQGREQRNALVSRHRSNRINRDSQSPSSGTRRRRAATPPKGLSGCAHLVVQVVDGTPEAIRTTNQAVDPQRSGKELGHPHQRRKRSRNTSKPRGTFETHATGAVTALLTKFKCRASRHVRFRSDGVRQLLETTYSRLTNRLPPDLAGRIDLLRPSWRDSWGGPLNGQLRRREIVRDLARRIQFDQVIETGTYRGTSTEFLSAVFGAPVTSIEANPRLFSYSSRRLAAWPEITVEFGDSRAILRRIADGTSDKSESVFAYLDAHWEEDLPLSEELEIIASGWSHAVVMIDDFQVPGDEGYAFDDYGPGKALTADYLPTGSLSGWSILYPLAASQEETGARRGCCVLASSEMSRVVQVPSLRFGSTF